MYLLRSVLRRALVAIAIFMFIAQISVAATTPQLIFKHFGTRDGLPSSQIYQVIQDHQGYLWFCSDHGVSRYNGYEFKVFGSSEGLIDNTVFKLQEDAHHRIWMQTISGRLFYLENDSVRAYKYNSKVVACVKRSIPLNFYVDDFENISFTVSNNGAFRIDTKGVLSRYFNVDVSCGSNQILLHEKTANACLALNASWAPNDIPTSLVIRGANEVMDTIILNEYFEGPVFCRRLKNGRFLVSLGGTLFEYKNHILTQLFSSDLRINWIAEGNDNDIWLCTHKGLLRFRNEKFDGQIDVQLPTEFVTGVILDHENGLWVTTLFSGVYYLKNSTITTLDNSKFYNDKPLCITGSPSGLYIGYQNGKIAKCVNNKLTELSYVVPTEQISSLWYDKYSGDIFVARKNPGVIRNEHFFEMNPSKTNVLKGDFERTSSGLLLNQTVNNLFIIKKDSLLHYISFTERSNCIFKTSAGILLAGTNNGVFSLNEGKRTLEPYHTEIFSGVRVDDIQEYHGHLLFLTHGVGLFELFEGKMKQWTTKNGLCSNVLHNIVVSEKSIWITSNRGVTRLEPDQGFLNLKFTNLNVDAGLPDNEINAIEVYHDTIWVACGNSVVCFPEMADFTNYVLPKVSLTDVLVNGHPVVLSSQLELPAGSNNLSIGFEAISFKSGSGLLYKYVLVNGSDSVSSLTADRRVEFLSLLPGEYLFKVNAMNSSGLWSDHSLEFRFVIFPPFWKTWWFLCLIFVSVVFVWWRWFHKRIDRVRMEEQRKAETNRQMASLEMKALRAQMNPHFIFNVMNSIQDYILNNDSQSAQKYLTKFARLVRLILNNSLENEVLLSDELMASELYVELELQRFEGKFTFEVDVAPELKHSSLLIPSMLFQPYLENAIKHGISNKVGKSVLILSVQEISGELIVVIEDNGVGRAAASQWNSHYTNDHISLGTLITASRMESYNESFQTKINIRIIDLYDSNGDAAGTRVELNIPMRYRT